MKTIVFALSAVISIIGFSRVSAQSYTLEQVTSYPFASELTSRPGGPEVAWVMAEKGERNVYLVNGPDDKPRRLTNYTEDDGQEIAALSLSSDGKWAVYVRGGDHGGWRRQGPVNAAHTPVPPKVQIFKVSLQGGAPELISEGDDPAISPDGSRVAFIKEGQAWIASLNGNAVPRNLFSSRGITGDLEWSPDGTRLLFTSDRGDHSFTGIYTDEDTPIKWIDPSFSRDQSPRWSPGGEHVAFIRRAGGGGIPDSLLAQKHEAWSIWTADVETGKARRLWKAPETLRGSVPTTHGGFNLHWAAGNRIVYLSYEDGWPHLYSISAQGGDPLQLTSGDFMTEQIQLSPDGKWIVFCANTGPDPLDIDRRHIARVPVDKAEMELLTAGRPLNEGDGIEAYPTFTGEGSAIACLSGTPRQPLLPAWLDLENKELKELTGELIPDDFPMDNMIVPEQVIFEAEDGTRVHGQLFEKEGGKTQKPAVVFIHGGPQRQMLLGWSYMDYYSNTYAINQYMAELGFVVLSVNYRLGIGYGYEFHKPPSAGIAGASEYQDIKAGGEYLAGLPQVDKKRIGVYGGSYGGYLAAIALGKNSDLFAAGVDLHGVHDRSSYITAPEGTEQPPDLKQAQQVAWESSPVSMLENWTSPVLLIHADDDRNVPFSQSVDLARRLEQKNIPFEYLVIPDDTHHWMKYSNLLKVNQATVDFLKRKLMDP